MSRSGPLGSERTVRAGASSELGKELGKGLEQLWELRVFTETQGVQGTELGKGLEPLRVFMGTQGGAG